MPPEKHSLLILVIILGAIILLAFSFFIILFLFFYRQKQLINKAEKQSLADNYQRELLQTQIETQNQTLEYIGQELHDNIGQMLSVAMLHLNGLEEELTQSTHQSSVRRMVETIESTIMAVRQLAKTLDSNTVQRFGLRDSLGLELERINHTGRYKTQLDVVGEPYKLGDETEIILFRMAQESLNNALKHARARTLTITTDYQPDNFKLTIVDDGRGFDMNEATNRQARESGSGMRNLHQRAQLLGGSCLVTTKPGEGTKIDIKVPTNKSA